MARTRPGDWLSVTAAARRLGVSSRTLRRYTHDGKLPDVRGAGGRRMSRAGDLDALTTKGGGRPVGYARVSSARFGTGLTGHLLAGFGVTVTCTGQPGGGTWEQDLVQDMLAIVTSLAGRLCGQRPARTRKLRAVVAAEARNQPA